MSDLPCKNPNCKSHGQPHPNCRCYGDMAEGGEVESYCSQDRAHEPKCEYFKGHPEHEDPGHSVASFLCHGLHHVLKMGRDNQPDAVARYNSSVDKGKKIVELRINNLFIGKPHDLIDHTKSKRVIHDWIEKGGAFHDLHEHAENDEPQNFAEGGEANKNPSPMLHEHPVQHVYPEQNLMIQAAKGRMSAYLGGLKPQKNAPQLAFDRKPDESLQKKTYDKALKIAAHPMALLEEIHKGTINPQDITHFKNLHPEIDNVLQKKLTERVLEDQLRGKKPSYKVRQGLSLYLGAALGSEMKPANIAAAQATFQKQGSQQPQQQGAPPAKTSALSKTDDSYQTSNQSRISRSQHQKS